MTSRGRYIVLEGDEGAGKTAQLSRIQRQLNLKNVEVEVVREPGGDPFAENLRQILKHATYPIPPVAEVLAFSAARASMIQNVIAPLLDSGIWVVSDRSYLSTLIYQGIGHNLDSPDFKKVVEYAIRSAPPDLTIVLDVSYEEAQRRQHGRGLPKDRFDIGDEFRHKINNGYLKFKSHKKLIHVNGQGTVEEVEDRIMSILNGMIES